MPDVLRRSSVAPVVSRIARAQAYPSRPVRIVVPIAPAGSADIVARLIGQWMSERLGQQFVIDNRPGGGTNIGTEAVVRAPADGYTLLVVGAWNAINATLYENLKFSFIRDITPVAGVARYPNVMALHPSFPAKTVPEFIAYAKANPGKISMASAGNGTPSHVSGELFKMMAGINMVHVPYRGGWPALADLLGGQVQITFPTTVASIEYIKAGRLRALAVTTATRLEVLPDVPTMGEFARSGNGGVIVVGPTSSVQPHRNLIIALATQHRLPAIYTNTIWSKAGGLISYGPDQLDQYRRAASYVDRILKGEKPGDLPVQAPIKYELVINLKTAKALGLEIPPTLLARADEVIE